LQPASRDTERALSQENVEIVRSMYRRGDPGRLFDLLDEEVEVDASAVGLLPDHSGLVHGKDAVVEYFRHYWGICGRTPCGSRMVA
jgi:hypothetical protein